MKLVDKSDVAFSPMQYAPIYYGISIRYGSTDVILRSEGCPRKTFANESHNKMETSSCKH